MSVVRYRPSRSHIALGVIVVLSVLLRWFYYLEIRDSHLFQIPLLDSHDYHHWALALTSGDWGWGKPYWMGPLYPHLLALVYAIFGADGPAMQLLQWAANLLSIVLVYGLGTRLASKSVGLLAAALFALYGAPVFYAGFLLLATVLTVLYLAIVWQLLRALDRPSIRRWLILGLLIGLAGLARGNVLLLLLLTPLLLWREGLPRARRARLTAALIAGAILAVAPVTLRNIVIGGDTVLITSNSGINLLIGQQAQYRGIFGPVEKLPQLEFDPSGEMKLESELGRELKPSTVSRIFTGRALRRFFTRPGEMIPHYARKAYRFWNGYELPQIVAYDYWRHELRALRAFILPYWLLVALGLPGLWLLRGRSRAVLIVLIGGYFLSLWPFFPTARYRLPIAPLLAIAAAVFCLEVYRRLRENSGDQASRLRAVALPLGAALALGLAFWPRWAALDPELVIWEVHLHQASRASEVGDRAAVVTAARTAEAALPGIAETPYRLAGYLERCGEYAAALPALELADRRQADNRLIAYRIGRNLERQGRLREAVAAFERAAALDTNWAQPHFARALVLRQRQDLPAAVAAMAEAVRLEPGRAQFRGNLGSLLAEAGDLDTARRILQLLTVDYPDYVNGWFNLALVEYTAGRREAARRALDRAAALPGVSPAARTNIDHLYMLLGN